MIVIKKKRNEGKTTKLVELLKKTPESILLVHGGGMEASRIIREFDLDREVYRKRVIPWNQYSIWGINTPILIDNVDLFLQEKFNHRLLGVSINED